MLHRSKPPQHGDRFGKYTIVCEVVNPLGGHLKYKAYCDCGKVVIQRLSDIKNNTAGCRHCGCGRKAKKNIIPLQLVGA